MVEKGYGRWSLINFVVTAELRAASSDLIVAANIDQEHPVIFENLKNDTVWVADGKRVVFAESTLQFVCP
jgi:hypothetical protein